MSKADKSLRRILSGSADATVTFAELRRVLLRLGFEERSPTGSSHYTYSHPDAREILTIPRRKPLKPVYVRMARTFIVGNRIAPDGSF